MEFKIWLEDNERNIHFGAFWKDGTVVVYIGGKRYVYITDSMYHDNWKRMVRYAPWKVLNQIKDMVKRGSATMTEPHKDEEPIPE
jgi:hypothetical protein